MIKKKKKQNLKKKKATSCEKIVSNGNIDEDVSKVIADANIKTIKKNKISLKKRLEHLTATINRLTENTVVAQNLHNVNPVEAVGNHDVGAGCELIQNESSPSMSLNKSAIQQSLPQKMDRRSTVDVAEAAARAVKAALEASRQTQRKTTTKNNTFIDLTVEEDDNERSESELMPPPPPPPPPLPKSAKIPKNPIVGARYLQQQELLLARHKQLERMRREEEERRQKDQIERRQLEQTRTDDSEDENSELMVTKDVHSESSLQKQTRRCDRQSSTVRHENVELNNKVQYDERQQQNNYFYYDGSDYYSSDDEMSGSSLADSFPPLLHDLRIDQLPRPSNRMPAAAVLPHGVRKRLSSVPAILTNHQDVDSSNSDEEHDQESKYRQKCLEKKENKKINIQTNAPNIKETFKQDNLIIDSLLLPHSSSMQKTKTSIVPEDINKLVILPSHTKSSTTVDINVHKQLQLGKEHGTNEMSVKRLGTAPQLDKQQKHQDQTPVEEVTLGALSLVERKTCHVSTKLDTECETAHQEKLVDAELNSIPDSVMKRKRDVNQAQLLLTENRLAIKTDSSQKPLNGNEEKMAVSEEKESPPLKKKVIYGDINKMKSMQLKSSELQCNKIFTAQQADKNFIQSTIEEVKDIVDVEQHKSSSDCGQNHNWVKQLVNRHKQLHFYIDHEMDKNIEIQKLIKEYNELAVQLPSAQHLQQMIRLKQVLQLPTSLENKKSSAELETESEIDVLLTNAQSRLLSERKRKSSSLLPSSVKEKHDQMVIDELRKRLSLIQQKWKNIKQPAIENECRTNTDECDVQIITAAINKRAGNKSECKDKLNNDDKNMEHEQQLFLTEQSTNRDNPSDDHGVQNSIRSLQQQKRRLRRHDRERIEREEVIFRRQLVQPKPKKNQSLKDQQSHISKRGTLLDQNNRIERVKYLEKQKKLLQEKIKRDRQTQQEEINQERHVNELSEEHGENTIQPHNSNYKWSLHKYIELFKYDIFPLREQLMHKILDDEFTGLEDEEQAAIQSSMTMKKPNMPNKEIELDRLTCKDRGSSSWWTSIGMQRKVSPLVLSDEKSLNQETKLISTMPLGFQPQLTRPQTRTMAALVLVKDQKPITPPILTSDEKERLKELLGPKLLRMMTKTEEKWVIQLQSKSAELSQQVDKHWKAMEDLQNMQVNLLLSCGKVSGPKYKFTDRFKSMLVVTDPGQKITKYWKKSETERLAHLKEWKSKLSQLLETKFTNKTFFRELFERLVHILPMCNQDGSNSNLLELIKKLDYKPLKPTERQNLMKKIHPSKLETVCQSLQDQILQLVREKQLLEKSSSKTHPSKTIQKQQLQTQQNYEKITLEKSIEQQLPPKSIQQEERRRLSQNLAEEEQSVQPHGKKPTVDFQQILKKTQKNAEQNQQEQFTVQKQVNNDKPKFPTVTELTRLFELRNYLVSAQSPEKSLFLLQQLRLNMSTAGVKNQQKKKNAGVHKTLQKKNWGMKKVFLKNTDENTSTKWVLRKLTLLLFIEKFIVQRQLNQLNETYPNTLDKHQELSASQTSMFAQQSSRTLVLLTPHKPSTTPVLLVPHQSQQSEQKSNTSPVVVTQEQLQAVNEERRALEQRLCRVLSELKPLMELWQLSIRFPAHWLRQQLDEIERKKQNELLGRTSVIPGRQCDDHQRQLLKRQNSNQLGSTKVTNETLRLHSQFQRIIKFLKWRKQRVSDLIVELSGAIRRRQSLVSSIPINTCKMRGHSTYSVSLKLQQHSLHKQVSSKYLALLRLQRSSVSKKEPSNYSVIFKLQRSLTSKKISNYSALLKLNKSSIRSALSTTQKPSNSKHQFSVSLTPLQPFNYVQQLSNSLTASSTLSKQQLRNKRRFSDGNENENSGKKIKSTSTERPKLSSFLINSKQSQCSKSILHPKTRTPANVQDENPITYTVLNSDEETESSDLEILPCNSITTVKQVDKSNIIANQIDATSHPIIKNPTAVFDVQEENSSTTYTILDSDEETDTLNVEMVEPFINVQLPDESNFTANTINTTHGPLTKSPNSVSPDDGVSTVITISDSDDEDIEILDVRMSPTGSVASTQTSEKSNFTTRLINMDPCLNTIRSQIITYVPDDNDSNVTIMDSDKETESVLSFETSSTNEVPGQVSEKLTVNLTNGTKICSNRIEQPQIKNVLPDDDFSDVTVLDSDEETEMLAYEETLPANKMPPSQMAEKSNLIEQLKICSSDETGISTKYSGENLPENDVSCCINVARIAKQKEVQSSPTDTENMNGTMTEENENTRREKQSEHFNEATKHRDQIGEMSVVSGGSTPIAAVSVGGHKDDLMSQPSKTVSGGTIPIRVAIVENITSSGMTDVGSSEPLCVTRTSKFSKPVNIVAVVKNLSDSENTDVLMAVVRRLTETMAAVTRMGLVQADEKQQANPTKQRQLTTKEYDRNLPMRGHTVRRRRRLVRTITVDVCGTAVPKFRDHGFSDGTTEWMVHDRFVATIMAMTAAESIASYVPPSRMSFECAEKHGAVGTDNGIIVVETDENDKDGGNNGNTVNASTNTGLPLSVIIDLLEKTNKYHHGQLHGCTDDHLWSGCARASGSLLVSAFKAIKVAGLSLQLPAEEVEADGETIVPKSPTIAAAAPSLPNTDDDADINSAQTVIRPLYRRSVSASGFADNESRPVADAGVRSASVSAVTRTPKRSAEVAFSSLLPTSITTNVTSPPPVEKPKKTKSEMVLTTTTISPAAAVVSSAPTVQQPSVERFDSHVEPVNSCAASTTTAVSDTEEALLPTTGLSPPSTTTTTAASAGADAIVAVDKTTTVTEEETRTVTVTRTRCPTVPASMDVAADACTLVVAACEQFVRAMITERLTKAGRGAGTLELRRRNAFAAAMATDENVRPTPEYGRTSIMTADCRPPTISTAAAVVEDRRLHDLWPQYKLLRPLPPPRASEDRATRPECRMIVNDETGESVVLTVDTTVETQTTITTTTTTAGAAPAVSAVKTKQSPPSDTSARTRGAVMRKTTRSKGGRGGEKSAADTSTTTNTTSIKTTSTTVDAAVNPGTRPMTKPRAHPPERRWSRGFFVERGRPLLRPEYHRRRPFGTLVATCVMAAAQTTAENDAAHAYFVDDCRQAEAVDDEENRENRGDDNWDCCYFGDVECLPPASRLSDFCSGGHGDNDDGDGASISSALRRSKARDEHDERETVKQRERLMAEIKRQQQHRNWLEEDMERRLREQRNRPAISHDEYYRRFMRLQYGSEDATPGPPKLLPRSPSSDGINSWF